MTADVEAVVAEVAFDALPLLLFAVVGVSAYRLGWWRRGVAEDLARKRERVRRAHEKAAEPVVASLLPGQRDGAE